MTDITTATLFAVVLVWLIVLTLVITLMLKEHQPGTRSVDCHAGRHDFQPRYTMTPEERPTNLNFSGFVNPDDIIRIIKAKSTKVYVTKVYVCDVCVGCGKTGTQGESR